MNIRISPPLCFSAQGQKENQEDALYPPAGKADANSRVLIVCDGMGGHEHGEVASQAVAQTIGNRMKKAAVGSADATRQEIETALNEAYSQLDSLDHSDDNSRKMGTTLTLLARCSEGFMAAHIGDSRIYQLRRGRGVLFQTHDHSLVNDLIASGELTEDEARRFERRNVITRAIMPHQEFPAKATVRLISDIQPGDVFLLCSDGVVEQIDNPELADIMLSNSPLAIRLARLEKECARRHTRDNHSCYAFEVEQADGMNESRKQSAATNEKAVSPQPANKRSMRAWIFAIIAFLALAVAVIAYQAFSQPSHAKKETKVSTQGNIKRNK